MDKTKYSIIDLEKILQTLSLDEDTKSSIIIELKDKYPDGLTENDVIDFFRNRKLLQSFRFPITSGLFDDSHWVQSFYDLFK